MCSCRAGVFSFEGREWEVVTEAAKDMISSMLVMDISRRATAKQLLAHRWFQVSIAQKQEGLHITCLLIQAVGGPDSCYTKNKLCVLSCHRWLPQHRQQLWALTWSSACGPLLACLV
jgi:hypothetical protein